MLPEVEFLGMDLYEWFIVIGIIGALAIFRIYTDYRAISVRLQICCYAIGLVAIVLGYGFAILFQAVYDAIARGYFELTLNTGATFYGGLIGGAGVFLALYFTVGKKICGSETLTLFPTVCGAAACAIACAHAFGRVGCLMAGCCHGGVTDSPLGIYMPAVGAKVVPVQLFEAIFLALLCVALSIFYFKTKVNSLFVYMTAYAAFRFVLEFFRADDQGSFVPGLSPSQFWSILLFIAGVALLTWSFLRDRKRTQIQQNASTEEDV